MARPTDTQSNNRLIVHGKRGLAERVRSLVMPEWVVVSVTSEAEAESALDRTHGPIVVLAGTPDCNHVAIKPHRWRALAPASVLLLLTTDDALADASEGTWIDPGCCLLREGASDKVLRAALDCALEASQSREAATAASGTKDALRLEADWAKVIAHDLRTPLGINNGYAALLLEAPEALGRPERREILERISENCDWMLRLVDGLLDVEALRHRGARLTPEPTLLSDLLEGVARRMERLAELQGIHIVCDPVPTTEHFGLDRTRVEQVLHNLVTNAVKFSPPGSEVRVTADADDLRVHFQVSDQGVGMTPEEAGAAFAKFTTGARGRGLGLAIARAIVELHGGRIWVETAPDAGSRFHFTVTATGRESPHADSCGSPSDQSSSI